MSSTMSMDMGTATISAAMPAATEEMSMDGMGMGDGCKISVSTMLFNIRGSTDKVTTDAVELEHH
jgi:hypothetical protein